MAFNFKTTKEIEEANKRKAQDEQNYRNFETYTPQEYQQSQGLKDMWGKISNWQTPTWNRENSTYWNKVADTMNAIENRKKFEYDLNGDMLYQQYKDQYMNQGNMAMRDTIGQAAAMTGGYGNSYAQSVGQQAYQGYLQQLNDKIPELYQLALDQYNREGDEMYNRLSAYGNLYNTEYGEHRDAVADSKDERSHLTNLYGIKSDEEYGHWFDSEQMKQAANQQQLEKLATLLGVSTEDAERLYNQIYQSQLDTYNTGFTEEQFAYQKEQDAIANQLARDQLNAQLARDQSANELATLQSDVNYYKALAELGDGIKESSLGGRGNTAVYSVLGKSYRSLGEAEEALTEYLDSLNLSETQLNAIYQKLGM